MTKVLFNTQKDIIKKYVIKHQFIQSMWFEEPCMTKILFNTQKDVIKY